ncbi:MAG: replication-relaxation family protein, partial [bacterium]
MSKKMKLVSRDMDIFTKISELSYLTAKQLSVLFSVDIRRMNRRLKKLHDAGYIERVQRFTASIYGKGEYAYFLTKKSVHEVLGYLGLPPEQAETIHETYPTISRLEHLLSINDFLIYLVAACADSKMYSAKFIPEHRRLKEQGKLISYIRDIVVGTEGKALEFTPDAVFYIENNKGKCLLFFLEIDTGCETIHSESGKYYDVQGKLSAYSHYFDTKGYRRYDKEFNYHFNGFRILFVTSSEKRLQN